jgi:hypothetical protein|tara:strand:- start:919 stop:1101 length:183 start_codon:yes stop_codon:yes gene_type:complete
MSQLIQQLKENIAWLRMANKYLERQYEKTDSWGVKGLTKKSTFDEGFMKEFDNITQHLKL